MSGQEQRNRLKKEHGGNGSDEAFEDHTLDQLVPDIENLISEIDAAIELADGEVERVEQSHTKKDRCTCW